MSLEENSYSVQVSLNCSSKRVFEALSTKIELWWGDQDRPVSQVGDVFTVSWGEPWYQFRVVNYEPNTSVVWECIDSRQIIGDLEGVEKEWVGTQLKWTIDQITPQKTHLHFVHEGLVPEFICYDVCSTTWDRFITFNLKKYVESGLKSV